MENYGDLLNAKRALSRKQLIDSEFPYNEYEKEILEGEYLARLDMKEWGKIPCIHCFFTTDENEKMLLIAYGKNNQYRVNNYGIDFSDMDIKIGTKYKIIIGKSKNNRTKWLDAEKFIEGC
ncbi:hypothetical protein [Clostridium estertheticum]|uniref:hypothetical protein n=1 Tax=Clostridium estertheticum TaxID=238834 RepID=UPI001C0B49CB|nr:hypothetical protein [Clostridium estertheticum]MBU3173261.1 hypothetical protein [Clostridium estertheticum]